MKGQSAAIFAVAVGASLAAHGLLWTTTHSLRLGYGTLVAADAGRGRERLISINLNLAGEPRDDFPIPDELKAPPEKVSEPEAAKPEPIKPEPPKEKPKPPKNEPDRLPDKMGRQDGDGIGTQEAKGLNPLQAREAENDQPNLQKDRPAPVQRNQPTPVVLVPGDGGTGGRAGAPARPEVDAAPPPTPPAPQPVAHAEEGESRPGPVAVRLPTSETGKESPADKIAPLIANRGELTLPKPGIAVNLRPSDQPLRVASADGFLPPPPPVRIAASPPPAPLPMRVPPAPEIASPTVAAPPVQAAVAPSTLTQGATDGAGGRPGPQAAADTAQQSDSEVDPFSKIGTWTIPRDGSMSVQFGRQVRPVRPRLNVAGMIDASLGARTVGLRVHIAADGHVTAVDLENSSGSNEVDQPCVVAMYDWWFEPLKNKKGAPIPDVVQFTLRFR